MAGFRRPRLSCGRRNLHYRSRKRHYHPRRPQHLSIRIGRGGGRHRRHPSGRCRGLREPCSCTRHRAPRHRRRDARAAAGRPRRFVLCCFCCLFFFFFCCCFCFVVCCFC